jgi:hypothetical protein
VCATGRGHQGRPEGVHLRGQGRSARVVHDQVGGDGGTLLVTGLDSDPGLRVAGRHAAICDHAADTFVVGCLHHDHPIEVGGPAGLHEQRNVLDDQGIPCSILEPGRFRTDQGMDDRVEPLAGLVLFEDQGAELRAVQPAVLREHLLAEGLHDGHEAGLARFLQIAHDAVGIDDHGTVLTEEIRHCGLT